MKPRVSVVMAVLNGDRFIVEAIQSIVDQNYDNTELVVVDDGSSDRTRDYVQQFEDRLRIVYVKHDTPRGIAPSMNDGVRHSSGDFISFLDHDDAWFPQFLHTEVDYLQAHPDVGMVHSDFQTIDVAGAIIEASVARARGRTRPSGWVFRELFIDSFIVGNSVLIRRECFQRLGLFDESLRWGDYHMWLRIARHYKVDYIPQVLTKYRQHPTQSTRTPAGERADALPVGARALELILDAYPDVRRELGERAINRRFASFYFDHAFNWFAKGEAAHARVCIRRALRLWPTNGGYLRLAAATYLGPATGQACTERVAPLARAEATHGRGQGSHQLKDLLYRALVVSGAERLAWRMSGDRLRILCYHGVCDDRLATESWMPSYFVRRSAFERQLQYLSDHAVVLHLADAVDQLKAGLLPANAVCITFDDGYANNLYLALPLLKQYGTPASVFLSTAYVESGDWYPFLKLKLLRMVNSTLPLPDYKSNPVDAILGAAAPYWPDVEASLTDAQRETLRPMTVGELRAAVFPLVEFGGHSETHGIARNETTERRRREVRGSLRKVAEWTQRPVRIYSYPNGEAEDFGDIEKEVLRDEGVTAAVSGVAGANRRQCDPLALKRYPLTLHHDEWRFRAEVAGLRTLVLSITDGRVQ